MRVHIFLDDERSPHFIGWNHTTMRVVVCRTFEDFVVAVTRYRKDIQAISFDHDLGLMSKSGYDCVTWLEAQIHYGNISVPNELLCHSMNPVGRKRINQVIDNIHHHFSNRG